MNLSQNPFSEALVLLGYCYFNCSSWSPSLPTVHLQYQYPTSSCLLLSGYLLRHVSMQARSGRGVAVCENITTLAVVMDVKLGVLAVLTDAPESTQRKISMGKGG